MLTTIHHEELCLWNIGIKCMACGREQYIGEIYNNWSEGEAPSDFMKDITTNITPGKRGKYL